MDDTLAASTVRQPAALERGAQLGRYLILDKLGGGGMGVVYTAYDPQLDRRIALKLLRPTDGTRAELEQRLLREGQAMARLSHPNVIAVHDVGTFEGQVFVAMEFVDGPTLRQWRSEPRPWREILDRYAQAGRGLAAAHAAGLIHRDFKPDNVLVGHDGRVRVLDFGLAVDSGGALVTPLTQTGAILGTPAYMAPEQLVGGSADARTDQFNFCAAFYEALYGERPFAGKTVEELALEVTQGRVRPAPSSSEIPDWLRGIVLRGLAVRGDDRFASMEALLGELTHDRDRDARLSDRARAIGISALGVLIVGFSLYQRFFNPTPERERKVTLAALAAWFAVTIVVGGVMAYLLRKRLFATQISRRILAAMAVTFYTTGFIEFAGSRFAMTPNAVGVVTLFCASALMVVMGVSLQRLFLWIGLLGFSAAFAGLAFPSWGGALNQLFLLCALALLLVGWTWGKPTK